MRQIAIECSGVSGSVAVLNGNVLMGNIPLEETPGTARTLAAAVQNLLQSHTGPPDFISVTNGPGSFTGLRVGLATAKTLAYAWNIPIVAINSLAVVAQQAIRHLDEHSDVPAQDVCVVVLMNAFRKQLFAAAYHFQFEAKACGERASTNTNPVRQLVPAADTQIVDVSAWQRDLFNALRWIGDPPAAANVCVTGPGVIAAGGEGMLSLLPQSIWDPTANALGQIAYEAFLRGETTTAIDLLPNYIRGSAAEENKKHSA